MNKYLIPIPIILLILSSSLQAQLTFGYVDQEKVFENNSEISESLQRLEAYELSLTEEIDSLNTLLEQKRTEYTSTERPDEKTKIEKQARDIQETITEKNIVANNNLGARRAQLIEPLIKKFNRVLDEIALENGVDIILNEPVTPDDVTKKIGEKNIINLTKLVTERLSEY